MTIVQTRAAAGPCWRPWGAPLEPLLLIGLLRHQASLLLPMPTGNAHLLSCRASRRPETCPSKGPCVFHKFDLKLNLAKYSVIACGAYKIGLAS